MNIPDLLQKISSNKPYLKYQRVIRYVIVGSVTNFLNVVFFTFGIRLLPDFAWKISFLTIRNYQVLDSLNYLITIVFLNYTLHKIWTFQAKGKNAEEFLRYIIILILNYFISLGILTVLIEFTSLAFFISKIISILIVITWNFFLLKYFVYRTGQ